MVNLKTEKISPKFRSFSREKPVTGFESMTPRVDTLRAIRRWISMQEAAGSTKSRKKTPPTRCQRCFLVGV